jgi:hypothetical protein
LGCGKPKQVHNVIIKWVKDKRNVGVLGQINNQMPILGLAHEQKHAHMISKGMFTKSKTTFCSCRRFAKKLSIGDKNEPLDFQKVGLESGQPRVT